MSLIFVSFSIDYKAGDILGDIFDRIKNLEDTALIFNGTIGNRYVLYWRHVVDNVVVKGDYILLHLDKDKRRVIDYKKHWTNIDISIKANPFEPREFFWKKLVVFPNNKACNYFYNFSINATYPIICWEVRHINGSTIMYDLNGRKIGKGVPAPVKGFSLSGYDSEYGPDCWKRWRLSADKWFKKWCESTISISSPAPQTISYYIRDKNVLFFYELAHGDSFLFQADREGSYYTSSMLHEDMKERGPMKFAFIGSCEGMRFTGEGTFSYEFRKGKKTGTVTIGYVGMAECPGWSVSLQWQENMFRKMDEGMTVKEAFDLASAYYPAIANCVKFVGDENLRVIKDSENPVINITDPKEGYLYIYGYEIIPTFFGKTIIIGEKMIRVNAEDNKGVSKVEFYLDDELKYEDTSPDYCWNLSEHIFGRHTLKAVAYDWSGNTAYDKIVIIAII